MLVLWPIALVRKPPMFFILDPAILPQRTAADGARSREIHGSHKNAIYRRKHPGSAVHRRWKEFILGQRQLTR
jgi:hypothetical protein